MYCIDSICVWWTVGMESRTNANLSSSTCHSSYVPLLQMSDMWNIELMGRWTIGMSDQCHAPVKDRVKPSKVLPTSCPAGGGASQAWGFWSPVLSHWHTADSQTARRSSFYHSLPLQRLTWQRTLTLPLLLFQGFHDKIGRVEEKNTEGFWRHCSFLLLRFHEVGFVLLEKLFYSVKVCDFGNCRRWTYANYSKF